jgi:hypothetical protein
MRDRRDGADPVIGDDGLPQPPEDPSWLRLADWVAKHPTLAIFAIVAPFVALGALVAFTTG